MTNKPTGEMHTPDQRVQAYTAQSATGEAAGTTEPANASHSLTRYDMACWNHDCPGSYETDGGDWGRYADVDALLAAKDAEMAALRPLADIGRLAVQYGRGKLAVEIDSARFRLHDAIDAYIANPTTATEEE